MVLAGAFAEDFWESHGAERVIGPGVWVVVMVVVVVWMIVVMRGRPFIHADYTA